MTKWKTTTGVMNRKETLMGTVLRFGMRRAPKSAGKSRLLHLETHAVVDLPGRSEQKNCQARARESVAARAKSLTS